MPQPFTTELAEKLDRYTDSEVITGPETTKRRFISSTGNHKIIHIGTHAESNNTHPERSRLFFAKPAGSDSLQHQDDVLYAYEIYDQDLSSQLTLLTACETGKPGYQPGEGMISLAHAFRYAGSQSLLTSLWNIDEKSSSQIVDLFISTCSTGFQGCSTPTSETLVS